MTKEELVKEAEVCMHNALFWLKLPISKENVEQGGSYILKLLEPREKQIQIDAEQIRALQKQNGELTDKVKKLETQNEEIENYFVESAGYGRDKVRNFMDIVNKALEQKGERIKELEAQIEKMKVCQNCDNWNWKHNKCEKKLKGDCFKHSKWVMRNF